MIREWKATTSQTKFRTKSLSSPMTNTNPPSKRKHNCSTNHRHSPRYRNLHSNSQIKRCPRCGQRMTTMWITAQLMQFLSRIGNAAHKNYTTLRTQTTRLISITSTRTQDCCSCKQSSTASLSSSQSRASKPQTTTNEY